MPEPVLASHVRRKLYVMLGVFALPALICWTVAYYAWRSEKRFSQGASSAEATITAIAEKTRFDGRSSEDITEVRVTFTDAAGAPREATQVVWSASGLAVGQTLTVLYRPAAPETIQLQGGFWNQSGLVVFPTIFGLIWAVVDIGLAFALWGFLRRNVAS